MSSRPAITLLFAAVTLLGTGLPRAQELPKLTHAVLFERGAALLPPAPTLRWIPGGHDAALVTADGDGKIVRRSPGQAEAQPLVEARALLALLGTPAAEGQPAQLPEWSFVDATTLRLQLPQAVFHWQIGQPAATRVLSWPATLTARDDSASLAIAPGDLRVAFVQTDDLHIGSRDGSVRRITWDGGPDIVYGGAAHRAEFGITGGLTWSSDGRRLLFYREDQRPIAPYPYQDLAAMPPAPRPGRYPMAGRPHSRVQVGVYDADDRSLIWLEHDPAADLYWTNLTFCQDSHTIAAVLVQRGQDRLELAQFSAATGKRLRTLLSESDAEWVEPEHPPRFLADGRFLWWSPRDGHRHLYLHGPDGAPLTQVTKGAFDVQSLLAVSADAQGLWFTAAGEDPRQRHVFYAKLDGSELRQITRERGSHDCTLSPDEKYLFDVWSNLETPPTPRFVDLQSGAAEALPPGPQPLAAFELPAQRFFQVKADDDTVLYGHLLLPKTIAEGQKLPVLLYVYGGPHVQLVTDGWLAGTSLWLHALANEGYVVCRLDNRGTPNRGIAFEQCVHRRLGTLEVKDQLLAVDWLKQQPFVDPARIGVHGWSYGGYLTLRLLLLAPDTFACGVSGAPVTDWAMYETGYTERYMDTPAENPEGYTASSCLPLADKLKSKLLLVHGTDDRTVMTSQSLAFVDRCVQAGVLLEYFPYPMQTHRLVGKDRPHFQKLLKSFLDRHLKPGG